MAVKEYTNRIVQNVGQVIIGKDEAIRQIGFVERLNPKLKWEGHCIIVQLLERLDKCGKALSVIRLVSAENAVKAFLAVIRDPCKLSAMVV